MAKKQTRRSVSISRGTYDRLKIYSEATNTPMSQIIEKLIDDKLDAEKFPRQGEGL